VRTLALIVAVATACACVPASAQDNTSVSFIVGFGPGFHELARWDMSVRFEGDVIVRFSGGGEDGTIVWTPGQAGQMTAAEGTTRTGHRQVTAFLGPTGGQSAVAQVTRGGRTCTDRRAPFFDAAAVRQGSRQVRIGLVGGGSAGMGFHLTETLCGGPLGVDLAQVLRPVPVAVAQLRKGRFDVDLRASGAFAHAALHGSVESTLIAHVGPRQRPPRDDAPPRHRLHRERNLEVRYAVERVRGSLGAAFRGGELCDAFASCGTTGSWLARPGRSPRGTISLHVDAPLSRSVGEMKAAVGLTAGPAPDLPVAGSGSWSSRGASLTATTSDGCSDTRRPGNNAVQLARRGGSVAVDLYADIGLARTSCPGPGLGGQDPGTSLLATAHVPLRAFRKQRVTIRFTRGVALEMDGWSGAIKPQLTLVLRRTRVRATTFSY
jgi:hypothetical protein